MTDKELLELAAKACGYKQVSASYHSDDDGFPTSEFWYLHVKDLYDGKSGSSCVWNPLTDDGDALRLAVKLRMEIIHLSDGVEVSSYDNKVCEAEYPSEEQDPYAATRRAIVRAAAEIGKEMK